MKKISLLCWLWLLLSFGTPSSVNAQQTRPPYQRGISEFPPLLEGKLGIVPGDLSEYYTIEDSVDPEHAYQNSVLKVIRKDGSIGFERYVFGGICERSCLPSSFVIELNALGEFLAIRPLGDGVLIYDPTAEAKHRKLSEYELREKVGAWIFENLLKPGKPSMLLDQRKADPEAIEHYVKNYEATDANTRPTDRIDKSFSDLPAHGLYTYLTLLGYVSDSERHAKAILEKDFTSEERKTAVLKDFTHGLSKYKEDGIIYQLKRYHTWLENQKDDPEFVMELILAGSKSLERIELLEWLKDLPQEQKKSAFRRIPFLWPNYYFQNTWLIPVITENMEEIRFLFLDIDDHSKGSMQAQTALAFALQSYWTAMVSDMHRDYGRDGGFVFKFEDARLSSEEGKRFSEWMFTTLIEFALKHPSVCEEASEGHCNIYYIIDIGFYNFIAYLNKKGFTETTLKLHKNALKLISNILKKKEYSYCINHHMAKGLYKGLVDVRAKFKKRTDQKN